MRSLILAAILATIPALGALAPTAALAQGESQGLTDAASESELWGEQDRGDDKGRVQATGRSYNTTHIAYAAVLIAIMGIFLIWLIRRHSATREPDRGR
jgi:ABC-type Fe3+ transport system permease subunit